jgi:glutamate:GABA antiporter
MAKGKHTLGVFSLAMMNVAVVMSLRGIPMIAKEGLQMIFFLLFASLLFLIPVSLVSAELATGWPKSGGVYRWVKEAFGPRWGFAAIWLQWIQNTVWYPTVLAFAAGALSYLFLDPALAGNKYFNLAVILCVYWGATFVNFRGMKTAGWVTTAGVISGTIFPAAIIIGLGVWWVTTGHPIEFTQTYTGFVPNLADFSRVAFLAGIVTLFAGMEVGAVHVMELKEPRKQYPKAVFLAAVIIMIVFTAGAMAVAAILPEKDISLTAGLMQTYHVAFKRILGSAGMEWGVPIIGFLLAFGVIGGVTAWIAGPSKGLLATAKDGDLPPLLAKTNRKGVQTHILFVQGSIVTILSLAFVIMPNVSSAFELLTALTATLYLIMYILLYAAAIRLRYTQPNVERTYRIPGGNFGMWIVAGVGLLAVLFAFVVGFFPPEQLKVGTPAFYVGFVIAGTLVFLAAPFVISLFRKPEWKQQTDPQEENI